MLWNIKFNAMEEKRSGFDLGGPQNRIWGIGPECKNPNYSVSACPTSNYLWYLQVEAHIRGPVFNVQGEGTPKKYGQVEYWAFMVQRF
jgi:hypothetical protein